jgi:hypothetical protein
VQRQQLERGRQLCWLYKLYQRRRAFGGRGYTRGARRRVPELDRQRELAAACQMAKGRGNSGHVVHLRYQSRELHPERGIQMLRLVVEGVAAIVDCMAYLREHLL